MGLPGRPKSENRSAQHEGAPVSPAGRSKDQHHDAHHEGGPAGVNSDVATTVRGVPEPGELPELSLKRLGGQGPDALLLHGFGSDSLSWIVNQPALEGVAQLYALDLPGHGASHHDVGDGHVATLAERVADALDRRGLKRLHLIGHSLGGGIALLLAQSRPDLVASLVLIAPAGLGHAVDPNFLAAYPSLRSAIETEALLRQLVQQPRLIGRTLVARVIEQLERPHARAALRTLADGLARSSAALVDAAAAVAASDLPRLVVWGGNDRINPLSVERLTRFGGESHIAPDVGHLPHVEAPRVVNAEIVRFLRQVHGG